MNGELPTQTKITFYINSNNIPHINATRCLVFIFTTFKQPKGYTHEEKVKRNKLFKLQFKGKNNSCNKKKKNTIPNGKLN